MKSFISTSGRKLFVTIIILGIGVAVTLLRGDLPHNLLNLLEIVLACFVGGNAVEHLAKMREARNAAPASVLPPEISADDLRQTAQALDARLAAIESGMMALGQAQTIGNQGVSALLDTVK